MSQQQGAQEKVLRRTRGLRAWFSAPDLLSCIGHRACSVSLPSGSVTGDPWQPEATGRGGFPSPASLVEELRRPVSSDVTPTHALRAKKGLTEVAAAITVPIEDGEAQTLQPRTGPRPRASR